MKTLKLMRYGLLLIAAFAYLNGPSRLDASRASARGGDVAAVLYLHGSSELSAAPSGRMSCDDCDENTPCDTECFGTFGEEPWETTCGDHRNWGGECAGECGDGYCGDNDETPSNCCEDCDPAHCPGVCYPDYQWEYISGPWAERPFVTDLGNNHYSCQWDRWDLNVYRDVNECPYSQEYEPSCEPTTWFLDDDYVSTPQNKVADCIAMMGHPPFGTAWVCQ